ncbi:MAG: PIN domain-containing protein [Nanoarchaeota archaeon]
MKRVIDTNVLIAGLIRDSTVRKILISKKFQFFLPEDALEEIEKYRIELTAKSGYTKEEFGKLRDLLLDSITLVSKAEIKPYLEKAEEIMKDIDIKDSSFVATALAINADGIWSFDDHFNKQKEIKIYGVKDLLDEIEEEDYME